MKLIILALILLLLGGCTSELPDNVHIIGNDGNSSLDTIGQVDSEYVGSSIGDSISNVSVQIISMYPINLTGFKQVDSYSFGNYDFVQDESGLWLTEIPVDNIVYVVVLNYDPLSLQNLSVKGNIAEFYGLMAEYNASTVLAFDPKDDSEALSYAFVEITESLGKVGVDVFPAMTESFGNSTLPVADCDGKTPIIKIINSEDTSISYDDACLIISGKDTELIRAADRFIWNFYGVMS